MSTIVDDVIDRVAEMIRRVGKREEIEDEIAQNVNLSDLANELIKEEGPVRDAAKKAVAAVIKNLEIESGDDQDTAIVEAIDFSDLTKNLMADPEIRVSLKNLVKGRIEGLADDPDSFSESVDEALGLNDAEKLIELFGDKDTKFELGQVVAAKVRKYLEDLDVADLDGDVVSRIEGAAFTEDRISASLATREPEIQKVVDDIARRTLEGAAEGDNDRFSSLVMESEGLKVAVDAAVDRLVRGGGIDRFVEQAVTAILSKKDSPLQERIQEAVSAKLIDRIAESMVGRLFENRR